MSLLVGVIIGLFMLVFLVTAHEFGHFLMARRNGVEVEEFGICFPPRAICWRKVNGKWRRIKKSEWKKMPGEGLIISLNWLPIGGFCQMKGESAAAKEKGSFGHASYWSKTKILFGGVAMNWLVAFVILTVLALTGMPHFLNDQFTFAGDTKEVIVKPLTVFTVVENSPAEKAGLQEKDIIRSVVYDGEKQESLSSESFISKNADYAGKEIVLGIEREGNFEEKVVKLNEKDAEYLLGASIGSSSLYRSTWSAPIVALGTTAQLSWETIRGTGTLLWNLVSGIVKQVNFDAEVRQEGTDELKTASDSVSGPVGIVGVLFPAFAQSGATNLFFLVALISISLACMNILPIPALDGGRWLLITIYKLRKKPLTKAIEEEIVGRAFTGILLFALIVTILDVIRIIGR